MKTWLIYSLNDPDTGQVRYIGFTTVSLKARLSQHIWETTRLNKQSHKVNWIRGLLKNGKQPEIKLIEQAVRENWQEREKYWIALYGLSNLVNTDVGGKGAVFDRKEESIWRSGIAKSRWILQLDRCLKPVNYFLGAKHAATVTGLNRGSINNCLKGWSKTSGSSYWVYADNFNRSKLEDKLVSEGLNNKKLHPVGICYESLSAQNQSTIHDRLVIGDMHSFYSLIKYFSIPAEFAYKLRGVKPFLDKPLAIRRNDIVYSSKKLLVDGKTNLETID